MLSNGRFAGFRSHPRLEGSHAFLSPSSHHWINYTEEQLDARYDTVSAAQRGTELHAWAAQAIKHKRVQPTEGGDVLNAYINDAISYGMTPEQTLFYSFNCFGTADAIGFRDNFLRIHDYKSGTTKTSENQLYVYAALFCLEYGFKPFDKEIAGIELRIYQSDEVRCYEGDRDFITRVMSKIITWDARIEERRGMA